MTCRHEVGDPNCSSYQARLDRVSRDYEQYVQKTPDSERFSIEDVEEVGPHLVLKVSYPNCKSCSYEGVKVLVYAHVSIKDAIRWKKIDPHFRDVPPSTKADAPGPMARFPASEHGWRQALAFAQMLVDE